MPNADEQDRDRIGTPPPGSAPRGRPPGESPSFDADNAQKAYRSHEFGPAGRTDRAGGPEEAEQAERVGGAPPCGPARAAEEPDPAEPPPPASPVQSPAPAHGARGTGHVPPRAGHMRPEDPRTGPPPDRPDARRVRLERGGPLLVEGPVEFVAEDGTVVRCDRFRVAVCTCRRSRIHPWCDTSHRAHERPARPGGGEDA